MKVIPAAPGEWPQRTPHREHCGGSELSPRGRLSSHGKGCGCFKALRVGMVAVRQYVTGKRGGGGKMAMHLSREACAKVQVQGQGGHVLLGVARAWATEVGRSQTFLPGTLASRKQGQWRSFRHGFCTAVLLGDHSGGRLVDKRQHGRPYAGATVRQLVDPHPGETERERERDDAFLLRRPGERVCVETSCFPFRSAPNTHGPARCLQAPGEDVGGEAAPAVHSGGPTRIPALKLSLALSRLPGPGPGPSRHPGSPPPPRKTGRPLP